jgi:hypothetical protein
LSINKIFEAYANARAAHPELRDLVVNRLGFIPKRRNALHAVCLWLAMQEQINPLFSRVPLDALKEVNQ